jgi:hypothetical protein
MTPPYEQRLAERPLDRAEFDDFVGWLVYRSRPGWMYRPWPWASPSRRRECRQSWDRTVRAYMGRAYELGRRGAS